MHRARLFAKRRAVSLSPPSSSSRRSNAAPPAPHRVSDRPRRPLFHSFLHPTAALLPRSPRSPRRARARTRRARTARRRAAARARM
jgi:hypothetical protein